MYSYVYIIRINPLSKFKTDQGVFYTRGLFFETSLDKDTVLYTLKEEDHEVNGVKYKSFPKLFIESRDPTGYVVSQNYLGGYSHWKKLSEATWFKEHLSQWQEELEVLLKSEALLKIREEASSGKNAYSANKLLLEGGWLSKEEKKNSVGRPTKEKIKKEAENIVQSQKDVDDDWQRLIN